MSDDKGRTKYSVWLDNDTLEPLRQLAQGLPKEHRPGPQDRLGQAVRLAVRKGLGRVQRDPLAKISTDVLAMANYLMGLDPAIRVKLFEVAVGLERVYAERGQGDDPLPEILGRVRNIFLPAHTQGRPRPGVAPKQTKKR